MTFTKVINVLLLVAVIYFGYTQLLPWFKSLGTGPGSRSYIDAGEGDDGKCVDAARDAAETFSEEIRSFSRPPIDGNAWDRTYLRIENRIDHAEGLCACSDAACGMARSGLSGLRDLGADFSRAASGDGAPPINAASTMNRVYDSLDLAAEQARAGRGE